MDDGKHGASMQHVFPTRLNISLICRLVLIYTSIVFISNFQICLHRVSQSETAERREGFVDCVLICDATGT